ncbi:hypothetical protein [Halomonas sp. hl-4]|uniref:hypothetical protein n=1 Tax=Halomonas sp. hl-4 TaxID=1761789 RepID=UPI000BC0093B|nr:hypothetical protein [Halomonas sp. hl-4]SNY95532.1 hypothetical protein SAMN04488142_0032 [Halomonas sp. hl-4]
MDKQEWIDKAMNRLIERGFEDDPNTMGYAESLYDSTAVEYGDDPVDVVDQELTYY